MSNKNPKPNWDRLRRFLALARRVLGLVLLVLEAIRRLLDLLK